MNILANHQAVRQEQGFRLYALSNEAVEVVLVPELGARIVSLKNLRTGREWLWHPSSGLKLFGNRWGDDFSRSPLAGIDECFPTITPCVWRGRNLPDHGELWNTAWDVDGAAWQNGVLTTSVHSAISPFRFERTVQLENNEIRLSYRLSNMSGNAESFLWALHPLLRLQPGDQLQLPDSSRVKFNGTAWIDAVDVAIPEALCAKSFAWSVCEGRAVIENSTTGDVLEFAWNPEQNPALGLWLTRGGWHGHHHFAIEPANGDHDSLATAAENGRCGTVAPRDTVGWEVSLCVKS
jgi:galactose mutarotase-like enzyme